MTNLLKPAVASLAAWLALAAGPAAGQVVILHSFAGGPGDGAVPYGSLMQSGSMLFGMTSSGGSASDGTVFQIGLTGGGYGIIHTFLSGSNDGRDPHGSLIQVGASTLYGTTTAGGAGGEGTVFRMGTNGTGFGLAHSFAGGPGDGASPESTLTQSGSFLYGTTFAGGGSDHGCVFRTNLDGTGYTVLHSFAGGPADGDGPGYGALVVSGSTLFGMTSSGGTAGLGTIYKMNTDGTGFAVVHSFAGPDGAFPDGSLTLSGSTLYGMTHQGGVVGGGTVFKIGTDGSGFGVLHPFAGGPADGSGPAGDVLVSGSKIYGLTGSGGQNALGVLFGMSTDGSGYEVFHEFAGGPSDGADPNGDLILSGSTLYGMTGVGGTNNLGTIFSFTVVPEPSSLLLLATAGLATVSAGLRRRARRDTFPNRRLQVS